MNLRELFKAEKGYDAFNNYTTKCEFMEFAQVKYDELEAKLPVGFNLAEKNCWNCKNRNLHFGKELCTSCDNELSNYQPAPKSEEPPSPPKSAEEVLSEAHRFSPGDTVNYCNGIIFEITKINEESGICFDRNGMWYALSNCVNLSQKPSKP